MLAAWFVCTVLAAPNISAAAIIVLLSSILLLVIGIPVLGTLYLIVVGMEGQIGRTIFYANFDGYDYHADVSS